MDNASDPSATDRGSGKLLNRQLLEFAATCFREGMTLNSIRRAVMEKGQVGELTAELIVRAPEGALPPPADPNAPPPADPALQFLATPPVALDLRPLHRQPTLKAERARRFDERRLPEHLPGAGARSRRRSGSSASRALRKFPRRTMLIFVGASCAVVAALTLSLGRSRAPRPSGMDSLRPPAAFLSAATPSVAPPPIAIGSAPSDSSATLSGVARRPAQAVSAHPRSSRGKRGSVTPSAR